MTTKPSQLSGDPGNTSSDCASLNKSPSLPSIDSPSSKASQFPSLKLKKGFIGLKIFKLI